MLRRLLLNLFGGWFALPRSFPASTLRMITGAIAQSETQHAGELRLAIEARYSPWAVLGGLQVRERARDVFSQLRVWDTQDNSGVLLYLQLAERRVEIVADRGIAARVDAGQWQQLCGQFANDMRDGAADAAVLRCLGRISDLLTAHFPAGEDNPRELPDEPVVL